MNASVSKLLVFVLFLSMAGLAALSGSADATTDSPLATAPEQHTPTMEMQAGPPPPVVSGSIVNGSPYLSWSHVTQAEDYIVYRIDSYTGTNDSWVTTNNYVHDTSRYPVTWASGYWDIISYYVVSRDPYLRTGGASNYIHYEYD